MAFALGIIAAIVSLGIAAFAAFAGYSLDTGLPISESPLIYGWGIGLLTPRSPGT